MRWGWCGVGIGWLTSSRSLWPQGEEAWSSSSRQRLDVAVLLSRSLLEVEAYTVLLGSRPRIPDECLLGDLGDDFRDDGAL